MLTLSVVIYREEKKLVVGQVCIRLKYTVVFRKVTVIIVFFSFFSLSEYMIEFTNAKRRH